MTRYRRPDDVAMVVGHRMEDHGLAEVVYLSHLPSGSLMVLHGTSALVWSEALSVNPGGSDLVDRLADAVGLVPAAIRQDVMAFVEQLLDRRLLEQA
ncbi:MAG: PqqD family protein [Actinomycetota bacterium]|nr:PqqD family protein [Actinomycetota bacterium]